MSLMLNSKENLILNRKTEISQQRNTRLHPADRYPPIEISAEGLTLRKPISIQDMPIQLEIQQKNK